MSEQDRKIEERIERHQHMREYGAKGKAYVDKIDALHDELLERCEEEGIPVYISLAIPRPDGDNPALITSMVNQTKDGTRISDAAQGLFYRFRMIVEEGDAVPAGGIAIPIAGGALPDGLRQVIQGLVDAHDNCDCPDCVASRGQAELLKKRGEA